MDISRINIGRLVLALIGEGLIFILFLLIFPYGFFGDGSSPAVMWLDLTVCSIVYWLWILNAGVAPVSKSDASQTGIGGLGIRLYGSVVYSVIALGFMFVAVLCAVNGTYIAFKWQIMVQAIIFFCLLMWLYSSTMATKKTGQVYRNEQQAKSGKRDIKYAIANTLAMAEDHGASPDIQQRLRKLSADTRFISPSSSMDTEYADTHIISECSRLSSALMNPELNKQEIERSTSQLERYFERRKKTF